MEKKKKGKKIPEPLYCKQCMYSVVQFIDKNDKLFECIPDIWFVKNDDENKSSCYWPPKKGRSYTLRAMKKEIPDDSWEICECTVVSEAYPTYSLGYSVVREKCAQFYNTSSADEHLEAANFRRKHPGLVFEDEISLEKLFTASNGTKNKENEKSNLQQQNINQGKSTDAMDSGKSVLRQKKSEQGKSVDAADSVKVGVQQNKSGQVKTVDATESNKSTVQQKKIVQVKSVHATHREKIVVSTGDFNNAYSSLSSQRRSRRRTRSISKSNISSSPKIITQSRCIIASQLSTDSKGHLSSEKRLVSEDNPGSKNHVISSHVRRSSLTQTCSRSRRRTRSGSILHTHSILGSKTDSSAHSPLKICSRNNSSWSESSGSSKSCNSLRSLSSSESSVYSKRTISRTSQRSNSGERQRTQSTYSNSPRKSSGSCSSGDRQRRHPTHSSNSRKSSVTSNLGDSQRHQSTHSSNPRKSAEISGSQSHSQLNEQSSYRSTRSSTSPLSRSSNFRSNLYFPYRRVEHHLKRSAKSNRNVSENLQSCSSNFRLQNLVRDVKELTNIANKNSRRIDENNRRIARMEITVNKTFIMIQDMTHTSNIRMSIGNTNDKLTLPRGFKIPQLPMKHVSELTILSTDLKNKQFYSFLVNHEKEYCFPTTSTDNVMLTAYLKRFISLKVRYKIALKDLKGQYGLTLFRDFETVYLFITDVMKAGYRLGNKVLSTDQAKVILRTIWGRTNQLLKEERRKKKK